MTHYEHTDAPQMLRLLLKAALGGHRPVLLAWIDADDAECAAEMAVVEVTGESVTARTGTGAVKRIALWDVWDATLMDEEAVA
jgi:hypothetical protein